MPQIETSAGLLNAAVAISMHEVDGVDPEAVDRSLRELSDGVRSRVPHLVDRLRGGGWIDTEALLAHLHCQLFDEYRLMGDVEDYYNPRNSYVQSVLERRRGIPISLALIYKTTAEHLGLTVHGINSPGYFLAAVDLPASEQSRRMYVDVFSGGRSLTEEEALKRIAQALGRAVPQDCKFLAPATNRQWLDRMLQNLQNIFAFSHREEDLMAMQELRQLLNQQQSE